MDEVPSTTEENLNISFCTSGILETGKYWKILKPLQCILFHKFSTSIIDTFTLNRSHWNNDLILEKAFRYLHLKALR